MGAIDTVFPIHVSCTCVTSTESRLGSSGQRRVNTDSLVMTQKYILLTLLRDCAHVPSPTNAELPIDHYVQYQQWYTESLNTELLKYSFMPRKKAMTLSALAQPC